MASWFERGRPALFKALTAVCDQLDIELKAELEEKERQGNRSRSAEVEGLRSRVAAVARLEQENQSLKAELAELRHGRQRALSDRPEGSARAPLGEVSPNKAAPPRKRKERPEDEGAKPDSGTANLEYDYAKLAGKCAALRQNLDHLRARARKFRDERDRWLKYAESLEAKVRRLEKKTHGPAEVRGRTCRTADSSTSPEDVNPPQAPQASPTSRAEARASLSFSAADSPPMDVPTSRRRALSTPAGLSQSGSPARVQSYPSEAGSAYVTPDTVVLPRLPQTTAAQGDAVMKADEPSSDEPVLVSERTLRKRRHDQDEPAANDEPARRIKREHSSSDPVETADVHNFSPHESMDLDSGQDAIVTPRKRRLPGENDVFPVSGNGAARHRLFGPSGRVASLAGSGDGLLEAPPAKPPPGDEEAVLLRANRKTRRTLSDDPSDMDIPTRELPFGKADRQHATVTPKAGTPKATAGKDRIRGSSTKSVSRLPLGERATARRSDGPALRYRPLVSLRLDDFKINPSLNGGRDFAFSEVVRNKPERAELPGCTDPQCCGKHFRAMAQSELEAAGPSLMQRQADIDLLEDYLGEEAHKLDSMSRPDKEGLWLEAKTRELANRHGKHRHRFQRKQSPPGFWNAEFPTTQEIEEEREEGERRERRLVRERWREAMRGNGRWLFRDE